MAVPTVKAPESDDHARAGQEVASQKRRDQIAALRGKGNRTPADVTALLNLLADEVLR